MAKTDGRKSAQGGRTKPGFVYKPVTDEEANPGQSDKDLGARWGAGEEAGPRNARRRETSPVSYREASEPGRILTERSPEGRALINLNRQ